MQRETGSPRHGWRGDRGRQDRDRTSCRSLTHMIRNSVDHGLEDTAESARAQGKPETGTITLSAAHRSGRVIIEVSDDGGRHQPGEGASHRGGKGIGRPRRDLEPRGDRQPALHARLFLEGRGVGAVGPGRRSRCGAPRDPGARRARHDPIRAGTGHDLHHRPAAHPRRPRRHAGRVRRRDDGSSAVGDPRDAAPVQRDDPFHRPDRTGRRQPRRADSDHRPCRGLRRRPAGPRATATFSSSWNARPDAARRLPWT
jgi:hypothetical protein